MGLNATFRTLQFEIPGEAKAWARAGRNGRFSFTPKPQANYMGVVKLFASRAMKKYRSGKLFDGAVMVNIEVFYQWPKSWSAKKRTSNPWKISKPDIDNLFKIVGDACNDIIWTDDSVVAQATIVKAYDERPRTVVTVQEMWPLEEVK